MKVSQSIIRNDDSEIISLCKDVVKEIGMKIVNKHDVEHFLLDLQETDYKVAIFDFRNMDVGCLKWVNVIRRIRPKIPLIIISDNVDQKTGGKVYEEGTFYLYILPVQKEVLRNILLAAIASYESKESNQYRDIDKTTKEELLS
jgi:DNA-binding NtrC family response regulator